VSGRGRGATLAEATVALALLAVATVLALGLHAQARRSFLTTEDRAATQQSLRAAFDGLLRELRLAGFHHDPDGAGVDEPIEAAWETALVVRADLDRGTPEAETPEAELAGGACAAVSTGNDEIFGWVLARPDASGALLDFDADVAGVPRDGEVERVVVAGIAREHGDPPYTLYRFAVEDDSASVTRTPVADGIASLRFEYLDAAGRAVPEPGGADDAGSKAGRASVRAVRVTLGAHAQLDGGPPFVLSGLVVPRNLGIPHASDR
jgi:hypothetical protein